MSAALESQAAKETGPLGLLRRNLFAPRNPLPANVDLTGRTVLVTGANTGLGFEAARQFLTLHPKRFILAARSQKKGDDAAALLRKEYPSIIIDVWLLDMASYESVTAFAQRCEAELETLDYALLNAGAQFIGFAINEGTGHEATTQTNFLSTALLMILLLPIMKAKRVPGDAHVPRLTAVGSDVMYDATPPPAAGSVLAHMDRPRTNAVAGPNLYMESKLLLMAFGMVLAEHVDPDDVIVNITNPSLCKGTSLVREGLHAPELWRRLVYRFIVMVTKPIARTVEAGASVYLYAMIAQGKESHGSFASEWGVRSYAKCLYGSTGDDIKQRVWAETMEELRFAEASRIVANMHRSSE
jgi:NAD(P)-dependent dehydrogenase (short-subunit alcohol dehydrogenase family)